MTFNDCPKIDFDSEEVFLIEFDQQKDILFAPLRSHLAFVSKNFVNVVLNNEKIRQLLVEKLKAMPLFDIKAQHVAVQRIMPEIAISVTDDCNLNCVYCYACAGDQGCDATLSPKKICGILEAYFNYLQYNQNSKITYMERYAKINISGGGEPSVRPDLLATLINKAKELGEIYGFKCLFNMPTNCTFSKDVLDLILKEFNGVSVSFDGPEDIQNKHRSFRNGKPSYEIAYKNIKALYEAKKPFAFRVTVTDYSVGRLREIVDYFDRHFAGVGISIEKMMPLGRGVTSDVRPSDESAYNAAFIDVLEYAHAKGIKVKNYSLNRFDSLRTVFCGSVGVPNWTITTDGRIVACARDNLPDVFSIGKFDFGKNNFAIDESRLEFLRQLNVFEYKDCSSCFCKYNCAGDCPDLRSAGITNCNLVRNIGKYILSKKLKGDAE